MCWSLVGQFSGARDWGSNAFGSLLLLADNYIHQPRTKPQSAQSSQRTYKEIQDVSPALRSLCRSGPGWPSQPLPEGPGRPGLGRCRPGGLDCLASARIRGKRHGRADIRGSREGAEPRSSDKKRTIFARVLVPRRWSHSQARAIRGHIRRLPGGPACTAARARVWGTGGAGALASRQRRFSGM